MEDERKRKIFAILGMMFFTFLGILIVLHALCYHSNYIDEEWMGIPIFLCLDVFVIFSFRYLGWGEKEECISPCW